MEELWHYPLLILVGFTVGFINTIAGGASLITLPTLIFLGLPPAVANGTNRVAITIQTAMGVAGFKSKGVSTFPFNIYLGIAAFFGALIGAQIVILLLPQTPETTNILNAQTLGLLAKGAFIINPGRGPLIDDEALLTALENGQVGHATLDVFRVEPLPTDHPFWTHPKVTVTPHIASTTRPETAAEVITDNILRGEAGQPFRYLVDRNRGY